MAIAFLVVLWSRLWSRSPRGPCPRQGTKIKWSVGPLYVRQGRTSCERWGENKRRREHKETFASGVDDVSPHRPTAVDNCDGRMEYVPFGHVLIGLCRLTEKASKS